MKVKSLFYIYVTIFITLLSLIESSTEIINPIDTTSEALENIKYTTYDYEGGSTAIFSYEFSSKPTDNKIFFTIRNSITPKPELEILCILSTETDENTIVNSFSTSTNICQSYSYSKDSIYNVIASFSDFTENSKLYLQITSKNKGQIAIFFRTTDAFITELKSMNLANAFAFVAYEFNKNYFYELEDDYVFSSSEANSILIYTHKGGEIENYDETPVLVFTKQSLAAHFWNFEKIYIFIGNPTYTGLEETNEIKTILKKHEDKNSKLYYYKPNIYNGFNSFYYYCTDNSTTHYLYVNYGNLGTTTASTYYFKIHNLVGSETAEYADYIINDSKDVKDLSYSNVKRFNYLTVTDSHVHILKMKCAEEGTKINANIKYLKKYSNSQKISFYDVLIKDFSATIGTTAFNINYSACKYEFALEIFTPETEEKKTFTVDFESKSYELNNQDIFVFKITDTNTDTLTIKSNENIETVITTYPSKRGADSGDKYSGYFYYIVDDYLDYTYYPIYHEFNANYIVEVELENKINQVISLCYYLTTTAALENFGQNCFFIEPKSKKSLNLNGIFSQTDDKDFKVKEPQYYIVVYNDSVIPSVYNMSSLTFETDLNKSTSIYERYQTHTFMYLDATLNKNKDYYFNIDFESKIGENHIDLYILSDTSGYNELEFDIKCIMKYERAIEFIKPDFTEENNICHLINNEDYKSNVFHILFSNKKENSNEYLIIKMTPKVDMKVKFVVDENTLVESSLKLENRISDISEPSVYKIYEINKTEFASKDNMTLYDRDENGIEIYARNKNNFKQIFKGSFTILNLKELANEYSNYEKFLILFGRNDCESYCIGESKYQIKFIDNFKYIKKDQFDGYYHIPIGIKNCNKKDYYIIYDYGKEYKDEFYLSKKNFTGTITDNCYFDQFNFSDFEKTNIPLRYFHQLNSNKLHLNIIRFKCENNLFVYFDYFTKIGSNSKIELKRGIVEYAVIAKGENVTCSYISINKFLIEVISTDHKVDPIIIFQNRQLSLDGGGHTRTFIRTIEDINELYLAAPPNNDIPLRITPLISLDELEKTDSDNLYKIDDKFVYEVSENVSNITFIITKGSSKRLRLLLTEGDEMEICYNEAEIILLDKNEINCFMLKDKYELDYQPAKTGPKSYLVFYPMVDNQAFTISSINKNNDNNGGEEKKKDNDESGGGIKWYVILIIILIILIIIVLIVLVVLKMVKKPVTSEEIEKNVNEINRNNSLSEINPN